MGNRGIDPKGSNGLVSFDVKGHGEFCSYCKRELVAYSITHPTRDHVMPRSRGGRKTVWACIKCNNTKADMLPEEWELFMHRFPDWWKTGSVAAFRKHVESIRRSVPAKHPASGIPKTVPIAYADAQAQAAFEAVYKNRLYMLRGVDG